MSIENSFIAVRGTQVAIPYAQNINDAYALLKSKKTADADRIKAENYLKAVQMSDDGTSYAALLCNQDADIPLISHIDTLFSNVLAEAIHKHDTIYNIKQLMAALPQYARDVYMKRAVMRVTTLYGINVTNALMEQMYRNGSLMLYEYLCFGIAVCVKHGTDKQGNPTVSRTYLTRNASVLYALESVGAISGVSCRTYAEKAAWMDEKLKIIFSPTASKNFLEGKATVFALRPENDGSGKPLYALTKRAQPVVLAGEEMTEFYPIDVFCLFSDAVNNVLKTGVFNVEYKSADGTVKNTVLTLSKDAVNYSYSDVDESTPVYVNALNVRGLVGWRPNYFGINAFSLKKERMSTFSLAVDAFESLHAYDPANPRNVHIEALHRTPENYKDCIAARMVFTTVVSDMRRQDYTLFEGIVPALTGVQFRRDKRDVLMRWAADLSDEDLYDTLDRVEFQPVLKQPLRTRCINRRRVMPSYFKHFRPVDITMQPLKEKLLEIMKNGVLRIGYLTSGGQLQVLSLTTNNTVLARTYGKNYVAEWETPVVRLKYVIEFIRGKAAEMTLEQGLETVRRYDLFNALFPDGIWAMQHINELIHFLEQAKIRYETKNSEREKPETEAYYINGKIADGVGFDTHSRSISYYRTIDIRRILDASYTVLPVRPEPASDKASNK